LFLNCRYYIKFVVLKVIFTRLFGYIYELVLARNEPQFSHRLEQKRHLWVRSLGARTALNLYILNDCSTPKAIISPKEDAQRPIEQLINDDYLS